MKEVENSPRESPRPGPPKRRTLITLAVLALVIIALAEVVLPLVVPGEHEPHFSFERIPAWGSIYGLISCVAIIVVSKLLGKVWLMRRENYYDS